MECIKCCDICKTPIKEFKDLRQISNVKRNSNDVIICNFKNPLVSREQLNWKLGEIE